MAAGQTLVVEAGTTVQFVGEDPQAILQPLVGLNVAGSMALRGTAAHPVSFQAATAPVPGSWQGITISGSGTMENVVVRHALNCVQTTGTSATLTIRRGTFSDCRTASIENLGSVVSLDALDVSPRTYGLSNVGSQGTMTVTNTIIRGATNDGIFVSGGTVTVFNSTFDGNVNAFYVTDDTGTSRVTNSIFSGGAGTKPADASADAKAPTVAAGVAANSPAAAQRQWPHSRHLRSRWSTCASAGGGDADSSSLLLATLSLQRPALGLEVGGR